MLDLVRASISVGRFYRGGKDGHIVTPKVVTSPRGFACNLGPKSSSAKNRHYWIRNTNNCFCNA